MSQHQYLVCFDITDDAIRQRVGKKLGRYGNRIQRSIFEVSLKKESAFQQLHKELSSWIETTDSLYFIHLCEHCMQKSLDANHQRVIQHPAVIIV